MHPPTTSKPSKNVSRLRKRTVIQIVLLITALCATAFTASTFLWPTTLARTESVALGPERDRNFPIYLNYSYETKGGRHLGQTLIGSTWNALDLGLFQHAHPIGSSEFVFYNPLDNADSTVRPGRGWEVCFFTLCLFLGSLIPAWVFPSRSKQSLQESAPDSAPDDLAMGYVDPNKRSYLDKLRGD